MRRPDGVPRVGRRHAPGIHELPCRPSALTTQAWRGVLPPCRRAEAMATMEPVTRVAVTVTFLRMDRPPAGA